MARKKITDVVTEILSGFLEENGYELYSTEFVKEGRDWFLRVYVDLIPSEGQEEKYIGTEDCEKVSRFLSARLDEADPIEQNYYLEVSSPGMDRQLITSKHYMRYLGHQVEVKLYKGKEGTKNINGSLTAFEPDPESGACLVKITDENGKEWELQLDEIARTRLAVIC